jgi:predicted  nucleic acid-binding Zn-ribbon protein
MSRWEQLLVVQELDTTVDQLRHRLRTLPERAELEQLALRRTAIESELAREADRRDELRRSQRRLEDEIATINDKIVHDDKALYAGGITAPKDLQALQDEIASLQRRVRSLEDDELEIMELAEPVDAEMARLEAERTALDADSDRLVTAIAEAEIAIEGELVTEQAARDAAVSDVPPDMVSEYEQLRPQFGGIAIARLVGHSCGGCHLALSAVEIDRIKKLGADDPAHCEECGRLLVHT